MAGLLDRIRRVFAGHGKDSTAGVAGPPATVTDSEVNYVGLAGLLIDYHGNNARAEAARLTREAMEEADMEAVADWRAVEQAIGLLTDQSMTARQ